MKKILFIFLSISHNDPYDSCYYSLQTIDAQNAWNITTGSNSVRVGVIDTGIDADHEDLSANINTTLSRDFTSGTITVTNN